MKLLSIFSTMLFFTKIMTIPPNDGLQMTNQDYSDLQYSGARNRTTKAAIPKFGETRKVKSFCFNGKCHGSNDNCYEEFAECYYSEFRPNLRKSSRKSRKI